MNVYVPYSQTAPQTTNLRELKLELDRDRAEYGPGSSQGYEAFQRLNLEAARQGRPLDGLRRFSTDEAERFFAQVIPGPDGHHYWDGTREFRRNDGKSRVPARWWWAYVNGPLTSTTLRVTPVCGDKNCVNPEHCKCEHFTAEKRLPDSHLLGALQVMALRIGHAPTTTEWRANGGVPSDRLYLNRYGSWDRALRSAGLTPSREPSQAATPERCAASIRQARKVLDRWPSTWDMQRVEVRAALHAAKLPSSMSWIKERLGGNWPEALRRAGKT